MIKLPDLKEIRNLRKKLNISQENLGEKLGITQSTISRIENGTMDPPYSKVKKIFEFLNRERMKKDKIQKKAKDIMTRKIISINPRSSIKEAVNLMNENKLSQLPIIEKGKNIGSITAKIIQKYITDNPDLINIEIDNVKELPFPEIMKNWDIKDISNILTNYSAVLVKEYNKYIGIITDADFLQVN
ncbi:MAG: CBS domain-containing protein [Promethearchaeota archaeon]